VEKETGLAINVVVVLRLQKFRDLSDVAQKGSLVPVKL